MTGSSATPKQLQCKEGKHNTETKSQPQESNSPEFEVVCPCEKHLSLSFFILKKGDMDNNSTSLKVLCEN